MRPAQQGNSGQQCQQVRHSHDQRVRDPTLASGISSRHGHRHGHRHQVVHVAVPCGHLHRLRIVASGVQSEMDEQLDSSQHGNRHQTPPGQKLTQQPASTGQRSQRRQDGQWDRATRNQPMTTHRHRDAQRHDSGGRTGLCAQTRSPSSWERDRLAGRASAHRSTAPVHLDSELSEEAVDQELEAVGGEVGAETAVLSEGHQAMQGGPNDLGDEFDVLVAG
jgi:hypothetical protein